MRMATLILLVMLAGCATSRRAEVSGLGQYAGTQKVRVMVNGQGGLPVLDAIQAGAEQALARGGRLQPTTTTDDERELTLVLRVLRAHEPSASPGSGGDLAGSLHVALPSPGELGGNLVVVGELLSPAGDVLGRTTWTAQGSPAQQAFNAGAGIGSSLENAAQADQEFVARRGSDERLFLTPTALTLAPGEVVVSDDEVLALRLAAGLSRRIQLDAWGGAVPVPIAGGTALPIPGAILVGGAAGLALGGALDLGLKVRVLDETSSLPAIAISYDCLDLNATMVGVGGAAGAGGGGALAAAGVGGGTVNAQFNLFTVAATKHFGHGQLTAGTYLLDNHHFLPQSAGFAALVGAGGSGAAAGLPVAGSQALGRVPLQVQPFVSYAHVLSPRTLLVAEAFPWVPMRLVSGTAGARWIFGGREPWGPLPLDRVRVRLDAAAMVMYARGDPQQGTKSGVGALPWLGVGLDFF